MKRILYLTSKWLGSGDSRDGGDITVNEYVKALCRNSLLDVICFRNQVEKKDDESIVYDIHKLICYKYDFAQFKNYSSNAGEKFLVRFEHSKCVAEVLKSIESNYDYIFVQHIMFLIAYDLYNDNLLDKIVLLPMFTGVAYRRSGDFVPERYIDSEKYVLSKVNKIITPSLAEKKDLINYYNVDINKILLIPRSIGNVNFKFRTTCHCPTKLLYIASIRRQKRHLLAIELLREIKSILNIKLICAGTIQDYGLYQECLSKIDLYELNNNIIFTGTLSTDEIKNYIYTSDINVSFSAWETFGRGIFEGMAGGLPTIVPSKLSDVTCLTECEPLYATSINDLINIIVKLVSDEEFYSSESLRCSKVAKLLSEKNEMINISSFISNL